MFTEIVPATSLPENAWPTMQARYDLRHASADQWIESHASGTLRKNKRIGFRWYDQYLHERVVYEFGWCFEVAPASRVLTGAPYTEGDNHAVTESGWHAERYLTMQFFPEDEFQVAYLNVEDADGTTREGIGIVVNKTSAAWVGNGKVVFAIIAEFDKAKQVFLPANNPF